MGEDLLSAVLDEMICAKDVLTTPIPDSEDLAIYLPPFFFAETGVTNRLMKIQNGPLQQVPELPVSGNVAYDETQLEAIRTARESKITVLTGGPGTGKSTTTLGILRAFRGLRVLLAAPTGRAAKRLAEVTGIEAKTIHRLLEFKPLEGYQRNAENPLEGDVLMGDSAGGVFLFSGKISKKLFVFS